MQPLIENYSISSLRLKSTYMFYNQVLRKSLHNYNNKHWLANAWRIMAHLRAGAGPASLMALLYPDRDRYVMLVHNAFILY